MSQDEPGMGIVEAATRLDEVRIDTGAAMVMAFFETDHGEVALVSDPDGVGVFCNGQPVPMEMS